MNIAYQRCILLGLQDVHYLPTSLHKESKFHKHKFESVRVVFSYAAITIKNSGWLKEVTMFL